MGGEKEHIPRNRLGNHMGTLKESLNRTEVDEKGETYGMKDARDTLGMSDDHIQDNGKIVENNS